MLTDDDIAYARKAARERAGLDIGPDKSYLIEHRLAPLARAEGRPSVAALLASMQRAPDPRLIQAVAEALATRDTQFFRDGAPFELFRREMLPVLARDRAAAGRIRIWCAGCSTGQEPYSLAMILQEEAERMGDIAVEILATDFCARAIEKAQGGLYSHFDAQRGLSIRRLVAHFEQSGDCWRLSPAVRQRVTFKRQNLIDERWPEGPFDAIFCRNVTGAMTPAARKQTLARLVEHLADDGWLALGAGETAAGAAENLRALPGGRGVYARIPAEARAAA